MKKPRQVLLLFGAGASYGSEKDIKTTPALSDGLFQILRARFPSWRNLDLKYRDHFQDFEEGMNQVLAQHPLDVSELQRDMAKYFFNFHPSPENLYIRIIKRLGIKDISFASLNYDRLLEEAIFRSGFFPKYSLEDKKSEKEVNLCLPHGCSNLFLTDFGIPPDSLTYTFDDDVFDSSSDPKVIRNDKDFQNEINLNALPPIMACFNRRKTSAVGKSFLEKQKRMFEERVLSAGLIVIVGINVREHDGHIWCPLAETSAKLLYCSGEEGGKVFKIWRDKFRSAKNDLIFGGYFAAHFDEICNTAEDFLRHLPSITTGYN
ncbi:MAG: hypothetical protein KR126chlam6_00516 [Candidatus Anoxychlamydiales bacterium]|nr:hypothetical protein [Candidatus Anoxychlamydiales bacterium]